MEGETMLCEDCGKPIGGPSRYHDGGGEPLCEGCWRERYEGPDAVFPDDERDDDLCSPPDFDEQSYDRWNLGFAGA